MRVFDGLLLLLTLSLGLVASVQGAGVVELELVGDARGSAMVFQEWAQRLGEAGVRNVRLRTATDADKLGIATKGTERNPVYVVTGVVVSRDALLLPGGRYRRGDIGQLVQWLNDLAEQGPASERPPKLAFGLSAAQLDKARGDLAAMVGFDTQGLSGQKVVERIAERSRLPLKLDVAVARALADEKVEDDLSGLSCGTALAYVLRSAGFGLLPKKAHDSLVYVVAQADRETWPVGWVDEKPSREGLPGLYEFHNLNVQNVPVATVLEAIAKRLKTPVLLDRAALAREGIDPAKEVVSLPQSRTTYSLALRKLLFQARIKFEVRYDDAGAPLLWVTSLKSE